MTKRGTVRVRALAALVLTLAAITACSSAEEGVATGETTSIPSTTSTSSVGGPQTTQPREACSAGTLGAVASATFEAPEIIDVVCELEFATATLVNGPEGENLLLFTLQNGTWALVGSGPVADLAAVTPPASFSTTVIPSWQRLREARIVRANRPDSGGGGSSGGSSSPSSTQVNRETGLLEVCVEDGDYRNCSPVTTEPPPPVPEDPDAPPTTVKQSGFCRFNYNDPACVADPGYTP